MGFIVAFPFTFSLYIRISLHSRIATLPTITASQTLLHIGVAFKASSVKLGSATQRAMSNPIAYRHTSERILQHIHLACQPLSHLYFIYTRPNNL